MDGTAAEVPVVPEVSVVPGVPVVPGVAVVRAVPEASGVALAWVGFAPVGAGRGEDKHPVPAVGCCPVVGFGLPEATVLAWPA